MLSTSPFRPAASRAAAALALAFALALALTACSGGNTLTAPDGATSPARLDSTLAPHRSLGLAKRADTLDITQTRQLTPPLVGTTTAWTTSNRVIATVSASGLVTAVTTGTTVVKATAGTTVDSLTIVVRAPSLATVAGAQAAVLGLMGNTPSVATIAALGGLWLKYEQDFAKYADQFWTTEGADYATADFYDRALMYYVWWARTGNTTYLSRANQLALNARAYLESVNYGPQPYLMMIDGVALHALVTGDQRSAQTVLKVGDKLGGATSYWSLHLGDTTNINVDARTQARVLSAVFDAWYLKQPSPAGVNYASQLRHFLDLVLGSQSPTGAYRYATQCYLNKPFMTGMLDDALIRYYARFTPDARIPAAVKRAVDYMWANDWDAATLKFKYLDAYCASTVSGGGPSLKADANNLIVPGVGFVAKTLALPLYMARADSAFKGGVNGAWLPNSKLFNMEYTSSFRFFGYRF